MNPLSLALNKVGSLASTLLVWPEEGWLLSFFGLVLGTQLPLYSQQQGGAVI